LPYAINKYIPYNALNPFIKTSFFFYPRKKDCIRYLHKDCRKYRQLLRKAKISGNSKRTSKEAEYPFNSIPCKCAAAFSISLYLHIRNNNQNHK